MSSSESESESYISSSSDDCCEQSDNIDLSGKVLINDSIRITHNNSWFIKISLAKNRINFNHFITCSRKEHAINFGLIW